MLPIEIVSQVAAKNAHDAAIISVNAANTNKGHLPFEMTACYFVAI